MATLPRPRRHNHSPRLQALSPLCAGLALLVLLVGCNEQPVGIEDPDPDPIPAVTEGVRLEGVADSPALSATREVGPEPVPSSEIDDGFMRTRLRAVIAPDATVAEVNEALDLHDVGIVTMRPGLHAVTLVAPSQGTVDDARTLSADLAATSAFAFVSPAFEVGVEVVRALPIALDLPASGVDGIDHWALTRMPAAWNAAKLAVDNGQRVRALVPDSYGALSAHSQISTQTFGGDGGIKAGASHGFLMAGLIGADYDDVPVNGASPRPEELLGITSIPLGGLASWVEIFYQIRDQLPPSGPVVLNTSIGPDRLYEDSEGTELEKEELIDRALQALFWRYVMGQQYARFLHVGAAGNAADVDPGTASDVSYDGAWFVAARWDDPYDLIPQELLTEQERIDLEGLFDSYYEDAPWTQARSPNVLAVGASDGTGAKLASSNVNEDLRTIGDDILSTCLPSSTGCVEGTRRTWGTSPAAAIVSGIAAYIWNLKPDMSVSQLRSHLLDGYVQAALIPGILDAYNLTLRVDSDIDVVNAPVRRTLLDVTGPGIDTPPNGVFDEEDLAQFLTLFQSFEVQREGVPPADWDLASDYSRYDLNGNGITHEFGDGEAMYEGPFDLDANRTLTPNVEQLIEGQTLPFDEQTLTDLDVLCFYAYSDLYVGDSDSRTALAGGLCGNKLVVVVEEPLDPVLEAIPQEVRIRVGRPATEGTEWADGAEVEVTALNATVVPTSGLTDSEGYFRTTLIPGPFDSLSPYVELEADAALDGAQGSGSGRWVNSRPWTAAGRGLLVQAQAGIVEAGVWLVDEQRLEFGVDAPGTYTVSADTMATLECSTGARVERVSAETTASQSLENGGSLFRAEFSASARGRAERVSDGSGCEPLTNRRASGGYQEQLQISVRVPSTYEIVVEYTGTEPSTFASARMTMLLSVEGYRIDTGQLSGSYTQTFTGQLEPFQNPTITISGGAGHASTTAYGGEFDGSGEISVRVTLVPSG